MTDTFLHEVAVVESGDRLASGLCGGLLQRLGAEVTVVETPCAVPSGSKWPYRALLGAGKSNVVADLQCEDDVERIRRLVERADIVITSSDWRATLSQELSASIESAPIVCDVTAFGSSGPLAGLPYTDALMQAFAGLMDTTGSPDQEPVPTRIPVTECAAAVFATAGVLAALRGRDRCSGPQRVEIAMFDAAVSMLSTFLPKHFIGESPQRMGNRHPSMSPWNAYRARDGWLLLCSASDDMWGRVCEVVGKSELKVDPRFRSMGGRVEHAEKADAEIEHWIATHSVAEGLQAFGAADIPCGPVYTIAELLADSSLRSRGAILSVVDPLSRCDVLVPGGLLHGSPAQGQAPSQVSADEPRTTVTTTRRLMPRAVKTGRQETVLTGIRVLEMGSYTTAPLAARNLGALGAYVVKAEPPGGELSRASPPYRDGQSYFCTLSNSDKRSVAVDLRTAEGRGLFNDLLSRADVFVENMKPGVLARFGFGVDRISSINPHLVYCSVSGYGANSPLADRPAMDTTIQGMAGIMDLTRGRGVPFKVGISISDILGGQFALVAVLAGLACRDRTGRGQYIDLSMQELSAWLTQFFWNSTNDMVEGGELLRCRDGYIYVAGHPNATVYLAGVRERYASDTKAEAVSVLSSVGLRCAPVNNVNEVATHPQTAARELIVHRPSAGGKTWPLLACPIRLSAFPVAVRRALGAVGEDLEEVRRDWGMDRVPEPSVSN